MASVLVNTDLDMNSASQLLNLPDPTLAQHAATKAYVDAAVEGLAWKDSARVASQSNINLSSPGATIDGVTMATNDRVLVMSQTDETTNGIYVFNGSGSAMTRAADASTAAELEQAVLTVEEGTSAGVTYRQTQVNITLSSSDILWTTFGTSVPTASESTSGTVELATQSEVDTGTDDARAVTPLKLATWSGRVLRYASSFGDGSATSYAKTHNLDSTDPISQVWETGGNKRKVLAEERITDENTITVLTTTAPASNAYRIVVHA